MTTRVIGLDLSLTGTGIALPDGATLTVKTRQADGDKRLCVIANQVGDALEQGVDLAVVEDLPTHAKSAGITGMVHGAIRYLLLLQQVPYVLVSPATLKAYATGKGNADKTAMALAAFKRGGVEFADDNQCDAFWLRVAGLDWLGQAPFVLPHSQRVRLDKAKWPELFKAAA